MDDIECYVLKQNRNIEVGDIVLCNETGEK